MSVNTESNPLAWRPAHARTLAGAVALVLIWASPSISYAQDGPGAAAVPLFAFEERHKSGQNIAPVFEGWEQNSDGTFNMVFGYFNRNWVEQPDVPIGSDNNIAPGPADQGQPTHFYPRRNKFWFRVLVPKDFGNKELVWTLTVHGKTEKAYATLKPDYLLEKMILMTNAHMDARGGPPEMKDNVAPVVELIGPEHQTVKVGQPLELNAHVTDDGIPKPRRAPFDAATSDKTALGLRVVWFVDRGEAATVSFNPEQFKVYQDKGTGPDGKGGNSPWVPGWLPPPLPKDGMFPVKVTFSKPGSFVVRIMAHDGGLATTKDVTVTVTASTNSSASPR